jgi:hypothetical protein
LDPSRRPRDTPLSTKLGTEIRQTSGGCSVGIVRLRTKTTELLFCLRRVQQPQLGHLPLMTQSSNKAFEPTVANSVRVLYKRPLRPNVSPLVTKANRIQNEGERQVQNLQI